MDSEFGAGVPAAASGSEAGPVPGRPDGDSRADELLHAGSLRGVPPCAPRLRGFRAAPADRAQPSSTPPGDTTPPAPTRPASRKSSWRWAAAATAVAAIAVVALAVLAFRLGANSSDTADRATPAAAPPTTTAPTTLAVTDVYRQVVPSIVVITTSKGSLGSGVVVTDTGTVLTANHVVSDGGAITVTFADGTQTGASVASADKTVDIATLVPDKLPQVVVPAVLGGGVAVGADVVAMGNPLGLADSTTSGVVSGLNRTNKTDQGTLTGLIQFDAAVNPGSSGGPLLDDKGSVVGVVVSIADPGKDDSWSGIGFAVPIGAALGDGSGDGQGRGPQL